MFMRLMSAVVIAAAVLVAGCQQGTEAEKGTRKDTPNNSTEKPKNDATRDLPAAKAVPATSTPKPTERNDNVVVVSSELPEEFPEGFPVDPDSTITHYETGKAPNEAKMVKVFLKSTKDLKELATYYKEELPKNGWKRGTYIVAAGSMNTFFLSEDKTASVFGAPTQYSIKIVWK